MMGYRTSIVGTDGSGPARTAPVGCHHRRSPLLARLLSTPPIELARKAHCDILITA